MEKLHSFWKSGGDCTPGPLTAKRLEEAIKEYKRRDDDGIYSQSEIEVHHPKCPKLITGGQKACRCGTIPSEALFEDALAKSHDRKD